MKVKIKLSVEQFKYLVLFIDRTSAAIADELKILNARLFVAAGYKKIIDLQSALTFTPNKVKTFAIEINQFSAIMDVLTNERAGFDPYTLSIYCTLQDQQKNVLSLK